jgi:hypothetical protein
MSAARVQCRSAIAFGIRMAPAAAAGPFEEELPGGGEELIQALGGQYEAGG